MINNYISIMIINLFIVSLITCIDIITARRVVDQTIVEKAVGQDVTEQVVRLISRSDIFSDDKNLLRRIAYVESKFGEASDTFPTDYYGGIWQLDEAQYIQTRDASLANQHAQIALLFDIQWNTTTWQDLLKPLYCGLATRLFLARTLPYIPGLITQQADYWAAYYNNNPNLTKEYFIEQVAILEAEPKCDGLIDLCIVLDDSGSIGASDFALAKNFVANLVETFSLSTTRIGFVVYSTYVRTIFGLENDMTIETMKSTILGTSYSAGWTYTGNGIVSGIEVLLNATARPGVPQILAVFTDGESNHGIPGLPAVPVYEAAQEALDSSIISFAVGIGSGIGLVELNTIAYNITYNVFNTGNYQELAEFFKTFNERACEQHQTPEFDQVIDDTLKQNEKRYYRYETPEEGVTVKVINKLGGTNGFWSYTEPNPSSAFYDGRISEETFIPVSNSNEVYIAIQGVESSNNYSLEGIRGRSETTTPVITTTTESFCPPNGVHDFPYPGNCTLYIRCIQGTPIVLSCSPTFLFDKNEKKCKPAEEAECDEDLPNKCPIDGSYDSFPHETSCSLYHFCFNQEMFTDQCTANAYYDQLLKSCTHAHEAICHSECPREGIVFLPIRAKPCSWYKRCSNGTSVNYECGAEESYHPIQERCVNLDEYVCPYSF